MKHLLFFYLSVFLSMASYAQNTKNVTCENYTAPIFKGVYVEMPGYREINSGSKIIVSYEGEWPAEMQGAFEYAVKIWEEVLPMTLPIRICAKVGSLRGSNNVMSKVSFDTYNFNGDLVKDFASSMPMVKSVLLQDYHRCQQHRFCDEITDVDNLEKTDITITYNSNLIYQYDFSLDGNPDVNKYDFVTVALRDIAIGLGFCTSFTADVANGKINFTDERLTPFETLVNRSLGTADPYEAFGIATQGSLDVPLLDESDSLTLYAPEIWKNGVSLRYFVPNDHPISKLLTYDFGTGYIMRNLSGGDWTELFSKAMDWRTYLLTGSSAGTICNTGNSTDVLPYKGQVTLSFNEEDRANFLKKENIKQNVLKNDSSSFLKPCEKMNISVSDINTYLRKYDSYSPDGPCSFPGFSLSVLKKDGTWDCIYKTDDEKVPIVVKIEDLKLNCLDSDYARGTTGGLRYRFTRCEGHYDTFYGYSYYDYDVKYFTRDYTPQKVLMKYTNPFSVYPTVKSTDADMYFVDVKVGLANLEGITKVVIQQLDEGEDLPFLYEVEDFRKGYFIATLDRQCSTTLSAICYNENGYQRSNVIVIPSIGLGVFPSFKRVNDTMLIEGVDDVLSTGNVRYVINNVTKTYSPNNIYKELTTNRIELKDLAKGVYVLTILNGDAQIGSCKFVK